MIEYTDKQQIKFGRYCGIQHSRLLLRYYDPDQHSGRGFKTPNTSGNGLSNTYCKTIDTCILRNMQAVCLYRPLFRDIFY